MKCKWCPLEARISCVTGPGTSWAKRWTWRGPAEFHWLAKTVCETSLTFGAALQDFRRQLECWAQSSSRSVPADGPPVHPNIHATDVVLDYGPSALHSLLSSNNPTDSGGSARRAGISLLYSRRGRAQNKGSTSFVFNRDTRTWLLDWNFRGISRFLGQFFWLNQGEHRIS